MRQKVRKIALFLPVTAIGIMLAGCSNHKEAAQPAPQSPENATKAIPAPEANTQYAQQMQIAQMQAQQLQQAHAREAGASKGLAK